MATKQSSVKLSMKLVPFVCALFFMGIWTVGCPQATTTEKASETTAEKTVDGGQEVTPETQAEVSPEPQVEATPEPQVEATLEPQVEATPEPQPEATTLYQRLGEEAGITTVVGDFVTRVVGDSKINGYFLNSTLDANRLVGCLVKQIGEASGGPQKYDCKTMKESHQGLGISKQDFTDLVGHLVDALKAANVAQADIDTIAQVLSPMEADIVEDANNDKTVYQRVGRRPGIETVIADFVKRVVADNTINTFFASTDAERLGTCLVRQVCGIDGPCKYGQEPAQGEKGVSDTKPCKNMVDSHKGLGISHQDFTTLIGHLVDALKAANVAQTDIDALAGVVGPMCSDIVETDKDKCTAAP
ncbi:MAG: hypothetical protein H6727_05695 [Myxococcales bacterium]|nr:hypothetical protein [Myxococcales bacterium]